jgi:hypothetical protein
VNIGINDRKVIYSIPLVVLVDGMISSKTAVLTTKKTDIMMIDKSK